MAKKKKNDTRARELIESAKNTILHGKGIQRRIAADAARPVLYDRTDGIIFNPEWQDDWIDLPEKSGG